MLQLLSSMAKPAMSAVAGGGAGDGAGKTDSAVEKSLDSLKAAGDAALIQQNDRAIDRIATDTATAIAKSELEAAGKAATSITGAGSTFA